MYDQGEVLFLRFVQNELCENEKAETMENDAIVYGRSTSTGMIYFLPFEYLVAISPLYYRKKSRTIKNV